MVAQDGVGPQVADDQGRAGGHGAGAEGAGQLDGPRGGARRAHDVLAAVVQERQQDHGHAEHGPGELRQAVERRVGARADEAGGADGRQALGVGEARRWLEDRSPGEVGSHGRHQDARRHVGARS
jgi:hypothetical protein